ncbi:unnamed protein product [Leptosia nina]|uniref:USP domain-containing protein n=1 Tax=Leptosia nina TaxID=320188 RepID=A0AAV1JXC5_9NEOP
MNIGWTRIKTQVDNFQRRAMVVKKRKLFVHNQCLSDLASLADYIQEIVDQPEYLHLTKYELIKNCEHMVECLSRLSGPEEETWKYLRNVEDCLLYSINNVDLDVRNEITTAVIDKFYSYISDPSTDAGPVLWIALIVIAEDNPEMALSEARRVVQKSLNEPGGIGLQSALSCLYGWLSAWQSSLLSNWILCFIQVLEENELFNILIKVSVRNIANLFKEIKVPNSLQQARAFDVILHILACLRESADMFDQISPYVGDIMESLAADSNNWCRQLLQNLVDILYSMINYQMASIAQGVKPQTSRSKYTEFLTSLERHMASGECSLLQLQPWKARKHEQPSSPTRTPVGKVGLLNLGNTCYLNSVMQALLVARQFSTHVVLHMNHRAYWAPMGLLFAKMMHSITRKLNPKDFFLVAKPTFFNADTQHDSSEFLGYLFELLQSYENVSEANFDYSRPVILNEERLRISHPHASPMSMSSEESRSPESVRSRRSSSPSPSSSTESASGPGMKRRHSEMNNQIVTKRRRGTDAYKRQTTSFIDSMFGGVLQTQIRCAECDSSSLSQDVYRDLQLAFPEKPKGYKHSVQGLLEYYCSMEKLTGNNKYKCSECDELRDAEKSVIIETTPKYLILVLKNFEFDIKMQVQAKLMHSVVYNRTITLPAVRQDRNSYVLFAAVIHEGQTLDSGHYYTVAKDNDQWYKYDDDVVTLSDDMELGRLPRDSTPYILFYRRSDVEESSAPTFDNLPPSTQEKILSHNKNYVESVRQKHISRP